MTGRTPPASVEAVERLANRVELQASATNDSFDSLHLRIDRMSKDVAALLELAHASALRQTNILVEQAGQRRAIRRARAETRLVRMTARRDLRGLAYATLVCLTLLLALEIALELIGPRSAAAAAAWSSVAAACSTAGPVLVDTGE